MRNMANAMKCSTINVVHHYAFIEAQKLARFNLKGICVSGLALLQMRAEYIGQRL